MGINSGFKGLILFGTKMVGITSRPDNAFRCTGGPTSS